LLFVCDWGEGNDPTLGCDFGWQVKKGCETLPFSVLFCFEKLDWNMCYSQSVVASIFLELW